VRKRLEKMRSHRIRARRRAAQHSAARQPSGVNESFVARWSQLTKLKRITRVRFASVSVNGLVLYFCLSHLCIRPHYFTGILPVCVLVSVTLSFGIGCLLTTIGPCLSFQSWSCFESRVLVNVTEI